MAEHQITIKHRDQHSKSGRPKRVFWPECSCRWTHGYETVQRWVAEERGLKHVTDAIRDREASER